MKRWILLCVWLVGCARSAGAVEVWVRILSRVPPPRVHVRLSSNASGRIGTRVVHWPAGVALTLTAGPDGVTVAGREAVTTPAVTLTAPLIEIEGHRYTGDVTVRAPDARALFLVNRTPLDAYVAGVVASEALPGTPMQALRAQAVAVRSYAVACAHLDRPRTAPSGPHAAEGYDFCDLTHCQSFRGMGDETAAQAERSTRGLVLMAGARVVAAWYHSTCGGHTEDGREVGADPALRGVSDVSADGRAWCAASPHFRWRTHLSRAALAKALARDGATAVSGLQTVRVSARESDGRAQTVELVAGNSRRVSALDFWQALGRSVGWGTVESTWFDVRPAGDGFDFVGRGCGHGVGMCQYGSVEMARKGRNMEQILHHYYPGTRLATIRL